MLVAAVLQPMMVPRTLHEDAAHRDGRGGEEVPAAVPAAACTGIHPQVCLVHERGGLERQRLRFPPQARASETAQLLVDLRQEVCGRTGGAVRGLPGTPRRLRPGAHGGFRCTRLCHGFGPLTRESPEGRGWRAFTPGCATASDFLREWPVAHRAGQGSGAALWNSQGSAGG